MPDFITQLLLRIWDLIFYAIGVCIGTGIGVPIGNKVIKSFERHQNTIVGQAKKLVVNNDRKQETVCDMPRSIDDILETKK